MNPISMAIVTMQSCESSWQLQAAYKVAKSLGTYDHVLKRILRLELNKKCRTPARNR